MHVNNEHTLLSKYVNMYVCIEDHWIFLNSPVAGGFLAPGGIDVFGALPLKVGA